MSDVTPPPDDTAAGDETPEQKPTETVEFWRGKAREQEKRAKANADAAARLAALEDAQKTEAEKAAERAAAAQAELDAIPAKVAASLRAHLVDLHEIDSEDAELFLTATEPDLLLKQVSRLLGQSGKGKPRQGNHVPREGSTPSAPKPDEVTEFTRALFERAKQS